MTPAAWSASSAGQAVVEDDERGSRRQGAGDVDEVTERDPVDALVDDRRAAVVERDDREQVLVPQRARTPMSWRI